jgi:rRNA maturation endonuclease Nob1
MGKFKLKPGENLYSCWACKKVVKRASSKTWYKSFCETTGKNVRLRLVKSGNRVHK